MTYRVHRCLGTNPEKSFFYRASQLVSEGLKCLKHREEALSYAFLQKINLENYAQKRSLLLTDSLKSASVVAPLLFYYLFFMERTVLHKE